MKQENKFYVGQDVYCVANGWGVINDINVTAPNAIRVKFDHNTVCYYICGRRSYKETYPSLYTYDPINNTKPPKRVEYIDYLGIKIPAPETEYPEEDTEYYYRGCEGMVENNIWAYWAVDKERFKYGIWLDKELAKEAIEKINSVLCINT